MGKKIKNSVEIVFTVNSEYKETFEKCVRADMGNINYKSVVMKGIRKSDISRQTKFSESDIWDNKDLWKTTLMRSNSKSLLSSRHHNTRELF